MVDRINIRGLSIMGIQNTSNINPNFETPDRNNNQLHQADNADITNSDSIDDVNMLDVDAHLMLVGEVLRRETADPWVD
jgi:hypothetical protein